MKYMGSKNTISKIYAKIIESYRGSGQWYVEPFCGGCNMIDKISGPRIANDIHPYLIEMFKLLQTGWIPPTEVSKEEYYTIKNNPDNFQPGLVGFVGFLCSFGGKWWGGYASSKTNRNYAREGKDNLLKQLPNLKNVIFKNQKYELLEIPYDSIIYCDPPYENTTDYKNKFDHIKFWEWCRQESKNHLMFISEYKAPSDFICIKEVNKTSTLNKNTKDIKIEKLFIHENSINKYKQTR